MLLVLVVTKGIHGLGMVKVGFQPGPGGGIGVQHSPLATMNERCAKGKSISSCESLF